MKNLVSWIDNTLFRAPNRNSLKLQFFGMLFFLFLIILWTVALTMIHGSLGRALIQSIILSTLVLPGIGFLMCIFRTPNRNQLADDYAEGRYFVLPIILVGGITFKTFYSIYNKYISGINSFIYILIDSILVISLIVLLSKAEFGQWKTRTDKVKFINSSVAIFGIILVTVLTLQLVII